MKLPPIRDALPDWRAVKAAIVERNVLRSLSKQQLVLGTGAVVLVGLGALGAFWFFSGEDEPTETTATSSEQMPTMVTVTKADLRDDFTVNAKMAAESNLSYSLPAPEGGERAVVTSGLKQPGDVLHSGMPVVEINDRPILAFVGDIPMYRTLVRGVRGGDVERLQEALAGMGYRVGVDGRFGKQTEVALKKHFKNIGSTVPLCPVVEPISETPKKESSAENKDASKEKKKSGSSSKKGGKSSKTVGVLFPLDWFSGIVPIFGSGDADPETNDKIKDEQRERERQDEEKDREATEDAQRKHGGGSKDGGSGDGGSDSDGGSDGKGGAGDQKPGLGDGKSDQAPSGETVGPCLRVSDAIFIPVANAKVISAPKTGQILSGEAKLVVTDGSSGLVATIPETQAENLKPGLEASAFYKGGTVAITVASVTEVKTTPDGKPLPENAGPKNFTVTFTPKEQGIFNDLGDQTVLLTVPRSTPILGHLVVPQRAISQDATGATSVLVQRGTQYQAVRVESVGCVAGQCAVKPVGGQLNEGDQIRVDGT